MKCNCCHKNKEESDFYKNRGQKCKSCTQESNNIWKLNNRERLLKVQKDYNLKIIDDRDRKDYFRNYNISKGRSTGTYESTGERKVREILESFNLNFEKEKTFTDCKNKKGNHLFFDFYIPSKNLLIEFQGEQHYLPIFGEENLNKTKEHDLIKKEFAKGQNINLLEIPYYNINNINIK
jgi:hypothetical protein